MSVESTLAERGGRYGDFSHHAEIAQDLQDTMRRNKGWGSLNAAQKQALTVIADKIARILSGDPNYVDNWHDIQGYAKLVEDRLVSTPTLLTTLEGLSKQEHKNPPTITVPPTRLAFGDCLVCGQKGGHSGIGCPKLQVGAAPQDYIYTNT